MDIPAEIQAHFDGVFNKRFAEVSAKSEAKLKEEIAAVEGKFLAQIAAKEKELAEVKAAGEKKGKGVDDSAVNERIAAIEAKLKKANETAIKGLLESAAARLNAVDPEQVAILARMKTRTDGDGNLTVVNAEGLPRLNAANKPMTADELLKEFLDANPHLVKASGPTGAGSTGAAHQTTGAAKTMKRAEFDKLPPEHQRAFAISPGAKILD
ncbi:MAG: hypothetical protein HY894_03550 [Deltaproteobacteria bacterium]|nr:hypothetical protein [Deltaproteobacteria bacterium]